MSARVLPLLLHDDSGLTRRNVTVEHLVVAGWTGRDRAAVELHIKELGALGVKPPATTPIFYRASAARLTIADSIEVLGEASSGEGEFVLLQQDGRLWVGAGSDHTDREVEKYGVSVSKQMCDKPIAPEFWPMVEVAPHWDKLMLRAYISENGKRVLYQEGPVTAMLDPLDLIEKIRRQGRARRRHADVLRHAVGEGRRAAVGCFRGRARRSGARAQNPASLRHPHAAGARMNEQGAKSCR